MASATYDVFQGLMLDQGYGRRIRLLENTYVTDEWYAEVSAGTGTITPPNGAEFVMDSWPEDVDAVVSTISTGTPPDIEHARESDGTIVTTSFDANGNFVLSGVPSAYPVAIIYRYRVQFKDYDHTKSLNAFKLEDYDLNHLVFNTNPSSPPSKEGSIFWDPDTHMPAAKSDIAGTTHNFGLEDWTRIRNNGTPITDGMAVVGVGGFAPTVFNVLPALATPDGPIGIVGIATSDMPDTGDQGWATTRGHVADYDTQTPGWSVFDYIYVSDTVPGGLTTTPPTPSSYAIPVGFVSSIGINGSIYVFAMNPGMIIASTNAAVASGDPTGWHDESAITVSYDSTTRKITLTGDLKYSWRGQVHELTSPWVSDAHPSSLDEAYFLYSTDGLTFAWATSPWEFSDLQIAFTWYGTSDKYSLREVHGLMPWQAHQEFHQTVGTYKLSGGDLASYVLASTTAADRRPTVSAMAIKDEDITTINALLNSSLYTKAYLSGSGAQTFDVETADIVPLNGAIPYYNQFVDPNWVQTPMVNNSYMCVWLVGVPMSSDSASQKYRYFWVQGQTIGTLVGQEALFPSDLSFGDLSSLVSEFVFSAKIILRYTAADWHIAKVENLTGTRNNTTGSPAGVYLSTVSHDATLTGEGTVSDPLSVLLSGINYRSPIVANSTATISPSNGNYYTSTSALVTLTGSGAERFLPEPPRSVGTTTSTTANKLVDSAGTFLKDGTLVGDIVYNVTDDTTTTISAIDSATTLSLNADIFTTGEDYQIIADTTSREVWGNGVSADATLTINPTDLSAGDIFSIKLENGESRVILYDGTDFHKIGGVEIPMSFSAYLFADQTGLSLLTWENIQVDNLWYDVGNVFDKSNYKLTTKRAANWSINARFSAQLAAGGAVSRILSRIYVNTVGVDIFGDIWPDESNTTDIGVRASGVFLKHLKSGDEVLYYMYVDGSGSGTWDAKGDDDPRSPCAISGQEVNFW